MGLLLMGKIVLIASMGVVMVSPFMYFLKRDLAWDASKEHSLEDWYK